MAYEDLTGKQRKFVDAYIGEANCNATQAARSAGYNGASGQAGYALLKNSEIRAAIDERMNELAMSAEEILHRLTEHARGNIIDLADAEGDLPARLKGLTRQQGALIRKHARRPTQYGEAVSIEIHDAQVALLALAKRYELFPDHVRAPDVAEAIRVGLERLAARGATEAAGGD